MRILFWTWFAVSLCVLLFRAGRWAFRSRRRMATSGVGVVDPASSTPASAPERSPATTPAAARSEGRDPIEARPPPTPAAAEPTARAEPLAASPPSAPATRHDVHAAGAVGAVGSTIADLVQGIGMPCDLVPLPGAEPRPGTLESIAFATTDHAPDQVGEALAAELERLGFHVQRLPHDELLASRDDGELKAAVHRRAGQVSYGGRPAFPATVADAVAVELWRD